MRLVDLLNFIKEENVAIYDQNNNNLFEGDVNKIPNDYLHCILIPKSIMVKENNLNIKIKN